jgi:phage tail sheath protein FI
MPEYLAPGVYVEETSYRAKSIEGVSTTTTGLIGPTRYGPLSEEPDLITSLIEFERTYGDGGQLQFFVEGSDPLEQHEPMHNFIWHAVRAFFDNGGKRVYVQRIFRPVTNDDGDIVDDGCADAQLPDTGDPDDRLSIRARFPGQAGEMRIRLTLNIGPNILSAAPDGSPRVAGLRHHDVVWVSNLPSPPASPPESPPLDEGEFYLAERDISTGITRWSFVQPDSPGAAIELEDLLPVADPRLSDKVRVATLTLTILPQEEDGVEQVWQDLPLDVEHETAGARDSIFEQFAEHPSSKAAARTVPLVITGGPEVTHGLHVLDAFFAGAAAGLEVDLARGDVSVEARTIQLALQNGNDGLRPGATEYYGEAADDSTEKTGLLGLEDIEDIAIIAAPGATFDYGNGFRSEADQIIQHLIGHAERMRYRIAVLDSGEAQTVRDVRAMKARLDSKYAALYYPWIRVLDPVTRQEINLPPSGFVAGIYARNDIERAVYKAPANEVVTGAIGFEILLNKGQQDVLNPEGINCFRFFEGRGYRLWGARTISSDPEWKYVNLRRYFIYLERSIDRGTQWAVFEPNGERLWANVRRTVEDFLLNEFMMGALLGSKPEEAYFVKCDRSTMTQNDLDNGRLVCLIGVAALRPAEFVIFRIGQWTASRQ